ncbi:MAG: (Fe-S)-binding protein [Coriobacteriia bacterium]|nr:(Fe-S)-binding protein [Coriobacteriia bacterium]MBN2823654.1 (Fe-S)-binding protein [Coriobacteriia bacterium]
MESQQLTTLTGVIDKKMNRQLKQYMDICARCAICKDACHQYVGTGDFKYLPARRAELIRQIYKKYFTKAGEFVPALYEARDPDENLLEELYESTYACTGCRRCMYYCPFSIDTAWILSVAKSILIAAGMGNEMLGQLADAAIFKGDNAEMFEDVMISGFKEIEEEVRQITGNPEAQVPVGKQGADVLYVALAGAHSIRPAAVIFEEAGENWTISMFEAANYGFFYGDAEKARLITKRYIDEAKRLGVKEIVVPECGHAYRVAEFFYEAWSKEPMPFKVSHILEKVDDYIKSGRITVDKGIIQGKVTYHDPCQLGRNGGKFEQPRDIVKAVTDNFVDLTPNREKQWCCGGGGGIVAMEEFTKTRLASGIKKVEQLKASGASVLACPCENCRLQIEELNDIHELGLEIWQVIDLVVAAMPLPGNKKAAE